MNLEIHTNGLFNSTSYRLSTCLIDSGDIWDGGDGVAAVLLTHAHFDHIYGLNDLMRISLDAMVYTNDIGREMLLDARKNLSFYHESPFVFEYPEHVRVVDDSEEVALCNGMVAQAVFTPGHNPSCITWVINDMVFSGDSLIPGIKTVTNLPGGNKQQAKESEELIKHLAVGRTIFPGHKT